MLLRPLSRGQKVFITCFRERPEDAFLFLQVGWIFTDLVSEDTRKGTVRYSRNKVRSDGVPSAHLAQPAAWF